MTVTGGLFSLDPLPSLLAACLVLLLGTFLSQRVARLARSSIPSPIIGRVLLALARFLLVKSALGPAGPSLPPRRASGNRGR